ncbi:MAG: hypothetical protein ACTS44_01660 [Candidatus Hodgkinia cicadicola]
MSTLSLPQPPTNFTIRLLRLRNALLPCDTVGRTSERLTLNLFRWKFNFRRKWRAKQVLVNINGLS